MREAQALFLAAARRNRVGLAAMYVGVLGLIAWMHLDADAIPLAIGEAVAATPSSVLLGILVLGTIAQAWLWRESRAPARTILVLFIATWSALPPAAVLGATPVLLAAAWSLGAVLAIVSKKDEEEAKEPKRAEARGPRAQVASARTYALLLLAPIYVSVDLARAVRVGDEASALARKALTLVTVDAALATDARAEPRTLHIDRVVPGIGVVRGDPTCAHGRCTGHLSLDTPGEKSFTDLDVASDDLAGGVTRAHTALVGTAVFIGAPNTKDMSDAELFASIRDKIQSRTVRVPFIELDLGSARARVALAIVVLALLILLRNRLGAALRDGGTSDDEPWFLLDTGDRLERTISAGYFVIVMSVSSIVAAALLIIDVHSVRLALGAFWAVGVLLSLSLGARILELRARRSAAKVPEPSPPPRTIRPRLRTR